MNFDNNLGEGNESNPGAAAAEEPVSEAQVDSTVETQAVEGQTRDEGAETELTEEEFEKFRQEALEAAKDERNPKWFRSVPSVYEKRFDAIHKQYEPYKALETFGGIEEIQRNLELAQALNTTRTNDKGFPEVTTQPFVEKLDGQTRLQLLNDLSNVESPFTPGYTLIQEIFKQSGIPPERLPEIKNFLQNGYQTGAYPAPEPSELEQIPENLRATFSSLSPDVRSDLLASPEGVRLHNLENAKFRMEREENEKLTAQEREQQESQAAQQVEAEFQKQVWDAGNANYSQVGEQVLTSFVESLSQAGLSKLDALKVGNMVVNTIENPDTATARMNLEVFKAEGIEIDPRIPGLVTQLEELSRHQAFYDKAIERAQRDPAFAKQNDVQSLTARRTETVTKQVETRDRLSAYGNKIVAALAKKTAAGNVASAQDQNILLDKTTQRPNIGGQPSRIGNGVDLNDIPLEDLVRQDPYFARN